MMTNEHLTTKMGHRCECETEAVVRDGREVRDVRCCSSALCARGTNNRTEFDRDRNAAINILKAGVACIERKASIFD